MGPLFLLPTIRLLRRVGMPLCILPPHLVRFPRPLCLLGSPLCCLALLPEKLFPRPLCLLGLPLEKDGVGKRGTAAEQPKLNDPLLAIALAELAGSCSGHRTVHKV